MCACVLRVKVMARGEDGGVQICCSAGGVWTEEVIEYRKQCRVCH